MAGMTLSMATAALASTTRISPQDVIMLRRETFGDGSVTREEAEALFRIEDSSAEKCAGWSEFFVEALTDYFVHQEQPWRALHCRSQSRTGRRYRASDEH